MASVGYINPPPSQVHNISLLWPYISYVPFVISKHCVKFDKNRLICGVHNSTYNIKLLSLLRSNILHM